MSTDKEEIALYYEAKNDKVRKRLGIKGGFTGAQQKIIGCNITGCCRNGRCWI